jgi:hypothetical protein
LFFSCQFDCHILAAHFCDFLIREQPHYSDLCLFSM